MGLFQSQTEADNDLCLSDSPRAWKVLFFISWLSLVVILQNLEGKQSLKSAPQQWCPSHFSGVQAVPITTVQGQPESQVGY